MLNIRYFGSTDLTYTYQMRIAFRVHMEHRARAEKLINGDQGAKNDQMAE